MDIVNLLFIILCILSISLFTFVTVLFTNPHVITDFISKRSSKKHVNIYDWEHDHTDTDFTKFLQACAHGNLDKIHGILHYHPKYINQYSDESGETCLHVAAILGQTEVTRIILSEFHGNPNVRSQFKDGGHRMTPLGWNIYHGHYDTIKAMIQYSSQTDINLDVDSMIFPGKIVTPLDMVYHVLPNNHLHDNHEPITGNQRVETFYKIKELLLNHGAKTYGQIQKEKEEANDEL